MIGSPCKSCSATGKTAMDSPIANTPAPPYYAVIFTSRHGDDTEDYGEMADRMVELAGTMPGYLGIESVKNDEGQGITVSYWETEEAIRNWKANADHRVAQETGRTRWYEEYALRIARVERAYGMQPSV